MHNFLIKVNMDNAASQQILSSAVVEILYDACAHQLWVLTAIHNLELEIVHKPGTDLVLADALSRSFGSQSAKVKASAMYQQLSLKRIRVKFSLDNIHFTL